MSPYIHALKGRGFTATDDKNELFPTGAELIGYAYLDSMGTIQFELPNIQSGENLTLTIFKI